MFNFKAIFSTSKYILRTRPTSKFGLLPFTSNFKRILCTNAGNPLPFTELVDDHLSPKDFYHILLKEGVQLFVGVPDSLLKDFCSYVYTTAPNRIIITSNEGSAIGLAAGHYLSTGKIPVVYLQNSGLGNTANPLVSLTHPEVYGIPMLLVIGWRGEPTKRDEPQHRAQGRLLPNMCQSMDLLYSILPSYKDGAATIAKMAFKHMRSKSSPYALLVTRNTFAKYDDPSFQEIEEHRYPVGREEALRIILSHLHSTDVVVGSTGFLSREIFTLREQSLEKSHASDFLSVGSMGHSPSIALGVALEKPARQVFNLEGDGSFIMHMGVTVTIGLKQPKNFKQIVINNGVHDSVGAQPTGAFNVDFRGIAKSCGYRTVLYAETAQEISDHIITLRKVEGPALLEIRVHPGVRKDLGRPMVSFQSLKEGFMNFLEEEDKV